MFINTNTFKLLQNVSYLRYAKINYIAVHCLAEIVVAVDTIAKRSSVASNHERLSPLGLPLLDVDMMRKTLTQHTK